MFWRIFCVSFSNDIIILLKSSTKNPWCMRTRTCWWRADDYIKFNKNATLSNRWRWSCRREFRHNLTFPIMQQFQAIEMIPGSYRYANRTVRTPLHKDFVKLVMEQQFSTVWLMHKDEEARVARLQQTTDEFLDEYRKNTFYARRVLLLTTTRKHKQRQHKH